MMKYKTDDVIEERWLNELRKGASTSFVSVSGKNVIIYRVCVCRGKNIYTREQKDEIGKKLLSGHDTLDSRK